MTVPEEKKIKCLVWDLDNTLWEGVILEDYHVRLRPGALDVVRELDRRGILQSIASKNDEDYAFEIMDQLGITEYFLAPQIGWYSKADSVEEIARRLNLGLDAFAFIDDSPYERAEVSCRHPEVRCYAHDEYLSLLNKPEFTPRFITEDSARRREMYMQDIERREKEREFTGSSEEFLKTLGMKLRVSPVGPGDLERVEELTLRTNQLNSTGITYSYEELCALMSDPNYLFYIAEMEDKFGSYGKIGLILAQLTETAVEIKLLLMSCRVMTRGIGSALLILLIKTARERGLDLLADFAATERNRIMYITYKLIGFEEIEREDGRCKLRYSGSAKEYPEYLDIELQLD